MPIADCRRLHGIAGDDGTRAVGSTFRPDTRRVCMKPSEPIESLEIAGRKIGPGEPVYFVAELSANHHQQLDEALALVRAAKDAGADAVKLQTYTPDTLTINCRREEFRIGSGTIWDGRY